MSKDVFERYKEVKADYYAGTPTESEVRAALRFRKYLFSGTALVGALGLLALFLFLPAVFLLIVQIGGTTVGIIAIFFFGAKLFDQIYDTNETLRKAKKIGVAQDK